jgi:hypothetical protein
MYFPVSAAGYFVYGGQITDNILDVVSRGPAHTVVSILIIAHLMLGFIIVINPFCQEIEHLLKIPTRKYTQFYAKTIAICKLEYD